MFAQQLVNGIVLSSTYALFALGFTLMFGVLKVLNLTYGFYFSAGAFVALFATSLFDLPVWLALPVGAIAAGAIAVVIDWLLLTPLRRSGASELSSLMVTIGAVLFFYSLMTIIYGTEIRRFPQSVLSGEAYEFAGIRITPSQLLIIGSTAVVVIGLLALMRMSRIGLAIRALSENPDAAQLMGVNTTLTITSVSFLSGAIGGAAGVLIGLNFNAIQPYMGEAMMLRGFAVIIIGGLGDLRGALVAGFALGILEVMAAGYVASWLKEALAFAVLVLMLWFRPVGLFGRATAKRA